MRRNQFVQMFCAIVVALLAFCSCNDDTKHLQAIPANSPVVIKANVGQILQKAEIDKVDAVKDGLDKIEKEIDSKALREKFQAIRKDPQAAGFKLTAPVALAVTDVKNLKYVFTARVDNRNNLDELFKALTEDEKEVTIKNEGDCTTIADPTNNSFSVAYDNNSFVVSVCANETAKPDKASTLLTQEKEKSILAQAEYTDFLATKDDVAFFFNFDPVVSLLKENNLEQEVDLGMLKGTSFLSSLNFADSDINWSTKIYPSEKLNAYIEKVHAQPSGKFLSMVPADAFCVLQGGFGDLKQIGNMYSGELREQLDQMLGQVAGLSLDELLGGFGGDVLAYAAPGKKELPMFGFAVECKTNIWNTIKSEIEGQFEKTPKGYKFPGEADMGCDYYLNYSDGAITFKPAYEGSGSFAENEKAAILSKGGFVFDIAGLLSINELRKRIAEGADKSVLSTLDHFKMFSVEVKSPLETVATLTLDDKGSSLAALIDLFVRLAPTGFSAFSDDFEDYTEYSDSIAYDDSAPLDTLSYD